MKTRAELLAQLEDEQAAGDPQWGTTDDLFTRVVHLMAGVLLEDNVIHLAPRRAA